MLTSGSCFAVRSDGKLLVLTPIDPIFLLLPVLEAVSSTSLSSRSALN
jgi:hypothetical protein